MVLRESGAFRMIFGHVSNPGLGGLYKFDVIGALEAYRSMYTANVVTDGGFVPGLITTLESAVIFNTFFFRNVGGRYSQMCEVFLRPRYHPCKPLGFLVFL